MRTFLIRVIVAMQLFVPAVSHSAAWIWVEDVSLLKYMTSPDGRVYVRNLNDFEPTAAGCCYNYYIDTATVEGRNIFALILAKAAQKQGLRIGVPNAFAPGLISNVGEF